MVNQYSLVSRDEVLSPCSKVSFQFWKSCYKIMIFKNVPDYQGPMKLTVQSNWKKYYYLKWLSSHWRFGSHDNTE